MEFTNNIFNSKITSIISSSPNGTTAFLTMILKHTRKQIVIMTNIVVLGKYGVDVDVIVYNGDIIDSLKNIKNKIIIFDNFNKHNITDLSQLQYKAILNDLNIILIVNDCVVDKYYISDLVMLINEKEYKYYKLIEITQIKNRNGNAHETLTYYLDENNTLSIKPKFIIRMKTFLHNIINKIWFLI